jgi:DNA-binding NarL/FixJ family response regulator
MISTILIDDHPLFNDGLCLMLKESGKFRIVEQVYDSRHAFFKYLSLRPQLVIVDYNMPHLNGLEVVKQLRSLDSACKIVVISMYFDKKDVSLFEEVGVDGYITKTTPSDALIPALEKVMAGEQVFISHNFEKASTQTDGFAQIQQLTKREREILKLLKAGYNTEQAAETLQLSYYTVETHRKNINQKMKFTTKKEFYDFLEKWVD